MSQTTDQHSAEQRDTGRREPAGPREPRGVADLFSGGRLLAIPRKAARREQLLEHLSETLFAADREYSEPEVNDALRTVHEDCSALRRYLITSGRLTRTRDGSSYRRATTTR
ncbi:DUF2087 domain-containing protein [Streptomyces sp. WAC07061]|uniref:DUF2087 domain-containing protein n=1 Tax=Streptomyces sp. WAC07061 TaxID=2487410 RepID=UPI000F7A4FAF|nr:DUF2087 domain-containing protein [Streptomyces sp. WAC07061]RSS48787.1 DUF2087 domain-containing protein [Streptomyces sp. WAC07061]